jgi:20S proteasome alpha/beta subunit
MYKLQENREIKPETFMHLVANMLYEKRYASLSPLWRPPAMAGSVSAKSSILAQGVGLIVSPPACPPPPPPR